MPVCHLSFGAFRLHASLCGTDSLPCRARGPRIALAQRYKESQNGTRKRAERVVSTGVAGGPAVGVAPSWAVTAPPGRPFVLEYGPMNSR